LSIFSSINFKKLVIIIFTELFHLILILRNFNDRGWYRSVYCVLSMFLFTLIDILI